MAVRSSPSHTHPKAAPGAAPTSAAVAESWSGLDLYVDTPQLEAAMNLHLSAQLGEWPAEGEPISGGSSPDWWQLNGWFGTTAHYNGSEMRDGEQRARFRRLNAIELVLEKSHFGSGEWALQFEVRNVPLGNGESADVFFPAGESADRGFWLR